MNDLPLTQDDVCLGQHSRQYLGITNFASTRAKLGPHMRSLVLASTCEGAGAQYIARKGCYSPQNQKQNSKIRHVLLNTDFLALLFTFAEQRSAGSELQNHVVRWVLKTWYLFGIFRKFWKTMKYFRCVCIFWQRHIDTLYLKGKFMFLFSVSYMILEMNGCVISTRWCAIVRLKYRTFWFQMLDFNDKRPGIKRQPVRNQTNKQKSHLTLQYSNVWSKYMF